MDNEKKLNQNEEMDTSFMEPKKKHHFGLILILLLIILVGGTCIYYFLLDTPKKFYTTIVDKLYEGNKEQISIKNIEKDTNISYDLSFNLTTRNKSDKIICDVLNQTIISGNTKYTSSNKTLLEQNLVKYKGGELLDLTYMLNLEDNIIYLKLNNIFDKIIKLNLTENDNELISNYKATDEDYKQVVSSLVSAIKVALNNANYKKEIVKLDNSYVKKQTVIIDKKFINDFVNKLLQDADFLQSISRIQGISVSEVIENLNDYLDNLEDGTKNLSVYTSIIQNEFIKLEYKEDENSVTITKLDNQYNFEIVESYTLEYRGYIKLDSQNEKNKITLSLESIEDETVLELYLLYSKNTASVSELDISNVIDYNSLKDEEFMTILTNLLKNETFNKLLEDLGLSDTLESSNLNM